MIIEYLRLNNQVIDSDFDMIYPPTLRKMSERHFTKIAVAQKAAQLLAIGSNQKILDIGSGVGKFCFVASTCTNISYTGVDYRKHFIELCSKLVIKHRFKNIDFIHANIIDIDFSKYDGFYFFNSFQEHTDHTARIDDTVDVNKQNYKQYSDFLRAQFERLPVGTRIVTYHARRSQIPDSYRLVSAHFNELLKCWQKNQILSIQTLMKYSKDKLLDDGIEKLRMFGFVNVTRKDVFEDEVYRYYFKKFMSVMLGENEDLDMAINELFSFIDKKEK